MREKFSLFWYESSLRTAKSEPEMVNEVVGRSWVATVRMCQDDTDESPRVRLENVSITKSSYTPLLRGPAMVTVIFYADHDLYPVADRSSASSNHGQKNGWRAKGET